MHLSCSTRWLLAPLLVAACAKSGDAPASELEAAPAEAPPAWSATAPLAPIPEHDGPVRYQTMNIDLATEDPVKTLAAARSLVLSLGGEITQANASAGSTASLTATLPPQALDRLRHGIGKLPGTIRSENSSVNDMTQQCDMLRDRLAQIMIADAEIERIMRTGTDKVLFDAMLVQRELATRERESLRQQLTMQLQQAKRAQFYLTIQPNVPVVPNDAANPQDIIHHPRFEE